MLAGQPSRTLLGPAIRRAAHQLLDVPLIFRDPIAVGLVPEASEEAIRSRAAEHQTQESLLLRSLFALRSRFAEDRLREAASRGVRQYLIFGAGLDTFPWRQPDYARDMRIFLTDHVSTLIWTQVKFWERGLPKPSNVTFVPLDLEQGGTREALAQSGFDPQAAAFCSMLGVTQYLERSSVEELLRFVASLGDGSEIVFSYVPHADDLARIDRQFAGAWAERGAWLGEPWKTRFAMDELAAVLGHIGFADIVHLTPERAEQVYFGSRQDGLRAPEWEQLIAAAT